MAGCASEEFSAPAGNESVLPMTLSVSRGGSATRTTLEEGDGGTMRSLWSEGDRLVAYKSDGTPAGELTLESGAGTPDGVFSGELAGIADGSDLRVWYYGASVDGKEPYTAPDEYAPNTLSCQFSRSPEYSCSGLRADLSRADLLSSMLTVEVREGKAYAAEPVVLDAMLALAHFRLTGLPEDVAADGEAVLRVGSYNGENLTDNSLPCRISYHPFTLGGGTGAGYAGYVIGNEVFEAGSTEADVYLPMIPGPCRLTFALETKGRIYRYTFAEPTEIMAGIYYCAPDGSGIGVEMEDVTPAPAPEEDPELVGPVFEVSGKKFRFTRANLQFNTVTSVYSIPEKQTEYLCKQGRRIGASDITDNPEVIGLFRWGATGIDDNVLLPQAADFWKQYAYEYSTSTAGGYFPSRNTSVNATISTNSTLCPDGQAQDTSYDWGKAYSAQNPGSHYFTLTSAELKSVINDWFAACCTVDGVNGAVILPFEDLASAKAAIEAVGGRHNNLYKLSDNYTNRTQFGYDRLTLTYEQLTELDGVFFPAGGMGNPHTGTAKKPAASDYTGNGYYWTSTPMTTPNASMWFFNGGTTQSSRDFKVYGMGKYYAFSVRLVKEIKD